MRTLSGQAKVLGTILGVGGAMVLTFYKGVPLEIWKTHVNLVEHNSTVVQQQQDEGNQALGSLVAVCCCLCYAIFLTIQVLIFILFLSILEYTYARRCTLICVN